MCRIPRKDFMNRVNQYAEVYEPVQDDECNSRCGYIKLINAGAALLHKFGVRFPCALATCCWDG